MKNIKWFFVILAICFMGAASAAPNLIDNGSFETIGTDGNPFKWENSSWGPMGVSFVYPATGRTGKAVKIKVTSANTAVDDRGAVWEQSSWLAVSGGQQFTYTDWTKGSVPAYLDVAFEMGDHTLVYQGLTETTGNATTWKKTVVPILVPDGAISMNVYRFVKNVGAIILDDVSLFAVPIPFGASGYVSFSFDDGMDEKNIPAVLNNLGIFGTFYINPDPVILGWEGYFTPSEVASIANKGHEVGNHGALHKDFATLSAGDLYTEVVTSKFSLENMIGRSIATLAYPYGSYTPSVIDLVLQYHDAARGVEGSVGIDAGINAPTQDRYTLNAMCPLNTTSVADIKAMIDRAKSTKQWLILCFHQFDQPATAQFSYKTTDLQAIVAYAKQKVKIITVQQGEMEYLVQ